jgi:glycosyltransferase involved in cell wall biosynthesis
VTFSITVLMTVHNESTYLRTAIDSILAQTFRDFHFLIVDDASTDDSREIVRSYQDDRIKLVSLEKNVGQTAALNLGLTHIETPWIARMDADDYSAPERLERQMEAVNADSALDCVGTFSWLFKSNPLTIDGTICNPVDKEEIKQIILGTPLVHGSIVISKKSILAIGGYDERYRISQDVDLFDRLLEHYSAANVPEFLLGIRQHPGQASRSMVALNENVELGTQRLHSTRYSGAQLRLVRKNLGLTYFVRARRHLGRINPLLMTQDLFCGIKISPASTIPNAIRAFGIEMLPTTWRAGVKTLIGKQRSVGRYQ